MPSSVRQATALLCLALGLPMAPGAHAAAASECPPEEMQLPANWTRAHPAYRVIANLYVVGPDDLSVFLVTTEAGHILINTGLADSTALIRQNMAQLGFKFEDIKLLLVMQAHFDHAAALAEIKALSGARLLATANDARVLGDGGASDPHFGSCHSLHFQPIAADRVITDGEVISLGNTQLTVHEHPGHTIGSSSYSMTVNERGRDYKVAIVNMGSINPGKRLLVQPTYDGIAQDFANTFRKQKTMAPDIWVAAHASQFNRSDKYQSGQPYSPDTFVDPKGFLAAIQAHETLYLKQLAQEQKSATTSTPTNR